MADELKDKVVLLTGATEGIGKAAALELARRGATLVLVGRNAEKTERVAAEVRQTGNGRVETIVGDLSKLSDIRAVAAAFKAKHDRLDVLANNAGAVFTQRILTSDGFEQTFALNHLNYFLLSHELLDVLARTPGARVVSTSSGAHRRGKLGDLDELAYRRGRYSSFSVYSDSKLANVLFTRELAKRVKDKGIVANCFHPGFVRTGFAQNNAGTPLAIIVRAIGSVLARTPEKGAETLVWLASSPAGGRVSGEYFLDCRVAPMSTRARDDEMARRLWAFSEAACGLAP